MKDAEERIAIGVLNIAQDNKFGLASFKKCRTAIPKIVSLTSDDLAPSTTRPGEPMWHQIVRNIRCHYQSHGNFIEQGLLEHVPRVGYRITSKGRAFLSR